MTTFDENYERAMTAAAGKKPARPSGDVGEIARLSKALAAATWGATAFGDARSALWKELEAGLRAWIRKNPPSAETGYKKDDPSRAVWLYRDELEKEPSITIHVVHNILFGGPRFEKVARQAISSLKSKAVGGDREKVSARFPEYPKLLQEIREAKRVWNAADAYVKTTQAFRVMGGLARITPDSVRYSDLVKRAQEMEKTALLGRILTSQKRAS
jgi:hypothetical protein